MSQFDYPRINFAGKATIDVGTANNCYYLPLVIFDPLRVKAVVPPRLYVNDQVLIDLSLEEFEQLLPEGASLQTESTGLYEEIPFVEIATIQEDDDFRTWAKTPLGKCTLDKAYWELYTKVQGEKSHSPLSGDIPGYWNFYGSMKYAFEEVKVSGIAVKDAERGEVVHDKPNPKCSRTLSNLLGAKVSMEQINRDGTSYNTGIMIDTEPTFSLMTQVFAENFQMQKGRRVLFQGKPYNAPNRLLNAYRIINENVPLNCSCNFVTSIPIEALSKGQSEPIMRIFRKFGSGPSRKLKGIYIQHNVLEVAENRNPDYSKNGEVSNAASATIVGSINPWYEKDSLKTFTMGRQLNGSGLINMRDNFFPPVAQIGPLLLEVDYKDQIVRLDFSNNIPEVNITLGAEGGNPRADTPYVYETYDQGELVLCLLDKDDKEHTLGSFWLDKEHYPREKFHKTAGMICVKFDTNQKLRLQDIKDGTFILRGKGFDHGTKGLIEGLELMRESQYLISTDQVAVYSDQYADPAKGYRSYSGKREPAILRIFERGLPVTSPIPITIIRYEYRLEKNTSCTVSVLNHEFYKDGDPFTMLTERPGGTIYQFVPGIVSYTNSTNAMGVLSDSFFAVNRVLPRHDYGKYLDKNHPEYPVEVTWKVLYNEIFRTYELIYPYMASRNLSFQAEMWDNPVMARELVKAISLDQWASAFYMPFTRELSQDQLLLIHKWYEKFEKKERLQTAIDEEERKAILKEFEKRIHGFRGKQMDILLAHLDR